MDAAGNLLGPGKAGLLNVTQDFGKVLEPISDQLDGSYKVKIGYTSRRYPAGFQKKPVNGIRGVKVPVSLGKYIRPVDGLGVPPGTVTKP